MCAMVGSLYNYNYDHLIDLWHLYDKKPHKMTRFKSFKSFKKLEAFAKNTNDVAFLSKIDIVKEYRGEIPDIVEKIYKHCRFDESEADYVFTTTHKSKGMEWNTVIMLDDFLEIVIKGPNRLITLEQDDDEKNLLYVCMTRATDHLVMNTSLMNLMVNAGDPFEKVVKMEQVKFGEHKLECIKCYDNVIFDDNTLGLLSIPMKGGKAEKYRGVFCSVCVAGNFFHDLKMRKSTLIHNKIFRDRNRVFLRYFIGVLPEKYPEALSIVQKNRLSLEINQFFNPLVLMFPEVQHYNFHHYEEEFDEEEFDVEEEEEVEENLEEEASNNEEKVSKKGEEKSALVGKSERLEDNVEGDNPQLALKKIEGKDDDSEIDKEVLDALNEDMEDDKDEIDQAVLDALDEDMDNGDFKEEPQIDQAVLIALNDEF